MSYELLRALAFAELAPTPALASALHASVVSGTPFVRILLANGMIDRDLLDDFLARVDGPQQRTVTPLYEVASLLPTGICERLLAVPVRRDPRTGTVDVAAVDLRDTHLQGEMEFHLKAPVRLVRASLAAIEDALSRPSRSQPPPPTDRDDAFSVRGQGHLAAPRAASFPSEASIPVQAPDEPFSAPPPPKYAPFAETIPRSTDSVNALADVAPASSRGPNLVPASTTSKSAPPPPRRQVATPPWGTPQPKIEAAQPLEASLPTFHPKPQNPDPRPRGITQVPPPIEPMMIDVRGMPTAEDAIGRRQREPVVAVPPPHALGTFRPPASTLDYVRRPSHVPLSGPGGDVSERAVVSFIPGPPPMNMRSPSTIHPDGGSVFAAMKLAEDRDLVLELLVSGARAVARRVALFVVKRGGFVGWTCTPEFSDRASLQTVMIPASAPSVFTTAMNEGAFLGAIRADDVHAPLLRVMRTASRDVAISPVSVGGKTVLFVVADELGDTMIGTRRLDELTRACGEAFARIVRTRR